VLVLSIHLSALSRVGDFKGLFDLVEVRLQEAPLSMDQEEMLVSLGVPLLLTIGDERILQKKSWKIHPLIVDLPWDCSSSARSSASSLFPQALLQGSFHSPAQAELDLPLLLSKMKEKGFDSVKIATTPGTTRDAVSLLSFLKRNALATHLTCVPMGKEWEFGRVLAMTLGSYLSYCCLPGSPTAEGQIDIATMHSLYSASLLSTKTARFALVGENVAHSPSHRTHTKLLRNFGVDGLYVKIPVKREDASELLPLIESLGFSGLSVTTPLKDMYGTFAFPINTMKYSGTISNTMNTDAPALVDALAEMLPLKGARALLIGAGAVGRASVKSLVEGGAKVFVYDRTFSKASLAASCIGGAAVSEDVFSQPNHFDIVVNTTSAHFSSPFPQQLSGLPLKAWGIQVAAEFAYPSKSSFLQTAEAQGIATISGTQLWMRQAAKQFQWWCGIDEAKALQFLKEELSCRLR
jgi:3-dehydroquinate dehydratase / shikimate dehydrogenase